MKLISIIALGTLCSCSYMPFILEEAEEMIEIEMEQHHNAPSYDAQNTMMASKYNVECPWCWDEVKIEKEWRENHNKNYREDGPFSFTIKHKKKKKSPWRPFC